MAQPMLGISNDREAIELDIQAAIRNPAKANLVKAKYLNIWSGGSGNWMNMVFWRACFDQELKDKQEELVKHLPCWIGSDLASKLDLSACIRLYRDDSKGDKPHYYALTRAYIPEERVREPQNQHYQKWVKDGFLTATRGASIDYSLLEADAVGDIKRNDVRQLAYDARYADQWSQRIEEISGVTRVEMPPSPAILSPAMKDLEGAVYDGRFHHDGHPVLTWCISNVMTSESGAGNYRMPDKQRPEFKIDAAIALFLAQYPAMLAQDPAFISPVVRGV
jgi:phage terminase large subunit-like protein